MSSNKKRSLFVKSYVREYSDFDYIDTLTDEEFEWLKKFVNEYYQNSFKKDGNNLHSKDLAKLVGQVNNERRRDVFSEKRKMGLLNFDCDAKPTNTEVESDEQTEETEEV